MKSLTIELISNASAKVLPNNILGFFTNFPLEQLNLEGQWEVAISVIIYQSMYQIDTERKLCFLTQAFQALQRYNTWKCRSYEHSHSRAKQSQRNLYRSQSVSKSAKS